MDMLLKKFIAVLAITPTVVFAQAAPQQGPSTIEMLIMPAGFLLIMYFFMIRPQQKRAREHQSFISALKPGDEVVTSGGIIGQVRSVADGFVNVEIAGNTVIKVLKSAIEGQGPKARPTLKTTN